MSLHACAQCHLLENRNLVHSQGACHPVISQIVTNIRWHWVYVGPIDGAVLDRTRSLTPCIANGYNVILASCGSHGHRRRVGLRVDDRSRQPLELIVKVTVSNGTVLGEIFGATDLQVIQLTKWRNHFYTSNDNSTSQMLTICFNQSICFLSTKWTFTT